VGGRGGSTCGSAALMARQRPSGRPGSPAALLGGPVWLQQGQLSALLPRRSDPGLCPVLGPRLPRPPRVPGLGWRRPTRRLHAVGSAPGRPGRHQPAGLDERRGRAWQHLAVAAHSLHPPRPWHAGPQPAGRPAAGGRPPLTWIWCLWRSPTASSWPGRGRVGELTERVRRAEDYAVLGARVVVQLHTESHAARPSTAPGR
jgi:hypothetical protein